MKLVKITKKFEKAVIHSSFCPFKIGLIFFLKFKEQLNYVDLPLNGGYQRIHVKHTCLARY